MPERMWEWQRRIVFGSVSAVSLDDGDELWCRDVGAYESADGIRAMLGRSAKLFDDDDVVYYATSGLLFDVVHAAGGVEFAYNRLKQSVAKAQASYDDTAAGPHAHLFANPVPGRNLGWLDRDVEDAWFAVAEMLMWARTLDERLGRRALVKKQPNQGLLPALAPGPRRDAAADAVSRLMASHLNEARLFANLNLHMQPTHTGSPRAEIRAARVVLPFPDRVAQRIRHRWELTYRDGRDAVSYADGLIAALERFMDELLAAFERHVPERFRAVPGPAEAVTD